MDSSHHLPARYPDASKPSAQQYGFLDLPSEIRRMIYIEIFNMTSAYIYGHDPSKDRAEHGMFYNENCDALLRVSKQCHRESRDLFFQCSRFILDFDLEFRTNKILQTPFVQMITRLHICVDLLSRKEWLPIFPRLQVLTAIFADRCLTQTVDVCEPIMPRVCDALSEEELMPQHNEYYMQGVFAAKNAIAPQAVLVIDVVHAFVIMTRLSHVDGIKQRMFCRKVSHDGIPGGHVEFGDIYEPGHGPEFPEYGV